MALKSYRLSNVNIPFEFLTPPPECTPDWGGDSLGDDATEDNKPYYALGNQEDSGCWEIEQPFSPDMTMLGGENSLSWSATGPGVGITTVYSAEAHSYPSPPAPSPGTACNPRPCFPFVVKCEYDVTIGAAPTGVAVSLEMRVYRIDPATGSKGSAGVDFADLTVSGSGELRVPLDLDDWIEGNVIGVRLAATTEFAAFETGVNFGSFDNIRVVDTR